MTISRKYCTCFSPYHSDGLDELILAHSRKVVVPACRYYVTPGDPLTELATFIPGKVFTPLSISTDRKRYPTSLATAGFWRKMCLPASPRAVQKKQNGFPTL